MISRSLKNVFNKHHRLTLPTQQMVIMPARSAGGGPKKPPMPSTERDFDIVLVGK
jgi:RNase P protein component